MFGQKPAIRTTECRPTDRGRSRSESASAVVRILLVDDNPAVRHYLRAILEQQDDWQICGEARNGREAIDRVQELIPDVVLLDFQLPDLNGLDVARHFRGLLPRIPILMVTVHMSNQLAAAARAAGICGICAKSNVGSIVEAVRTLLEEKTYFPQSGPDEEIRSGFGL